MPATKKTSKTAVKTSTEKKTKSSITEEVRYRLASLHEKADSVFSAVHHRTDALETKTDKMLAHLSALRFTMVIVAGVLILAVAGLASIIF